MTGNNHAGLKVIKQDREHFKYPICDNCKKEITTLGRYINRDNQMIYVHIKYDPVTQKCSYLDDF